MRGTGSLGYPNTALTPERAFGQVLRLRRTTAGMSQERLAEESGLDRTYISLLERGLRQPTLITILQLSSTLRISPVSLIEDVVTLLNEDHST